MRRTRGENSGTTVAAASTIVTLGRTLFSRPSRSSPSATSTPAAPPPTTVTATSRSRPLANSSSARRRRATARLIGRTVSACSRTPGVARPAGSEPMSSDRRSKPMRSPPASTVRAATSMRSAGACTKRAAARGRQRRQIEAQVGFGVAPLEVARHHSRSRAGAREGKRAPVPSYRPAPWACAPPRRGDGRARVRRREAAVVQVSDRDRRHAPMVRRPARLLRFPEAL